ncbi:MAG: NAD(P)H-dependent oxidoreductase subunit E [Verrucomicrobiae bacterium]|nr:NAD(P)H-dependent oxidoreductase subunit E [Verrucomicrobiae bacterium]
MPQFRPEFLAKVDEAIAHYPAFKRSASLPLLHLWQEEFGYISNEGIHWIAEKLGLQPIQILELVTFYPMFRQKPFGKYHIKVCRTLSCALGGSSELHERFKKTLRVEGDPHGPIHSPDGKYTLEFVECLASCGTAPVCMINDDFHEKVDSQEKINALLAKCN